VSVVAIVEAGEEVVIKAAAGLFLHALRKGREPTAAPPTTSPASLRKSLRVILDLLLYIRLLLTFYFLIL
jgi:hypothetical protein